MLTRWLGFQSCLSACDAAGTNCGHAVYSYATSTAEPAPITAVNHVFGICTFLTGTPTASGGPNLDYAIAIKTGVTVTATSAAATSTYGPYTEPTFTCPQANGETFTDSYGIAYSKLRLCSAPKSSLVLTYITVIACQADTNNGGAYGTTNVASTGSFNDCFYQCSTNSQSTSNCTAFTYYGPGGAGNGVGSGTCFLKNVSPESFIYETDTVHVAGIRLQYYAAGTYAPTYTTASATAVSFRISAHYLRRPSNAYPGQLVFFLFIISFSHN